MNNLDAYKTEAPEDELENVCCYCSCECENEYCSEQCFINSIRE